MQKSRARINVRANAQIVVNLGKISPLRAFVTRLVAEKLALTEQDSFDFVLINDVNKYNYHKDYDLCMKLLRHGGLMLITDVSISPKDFQSTLSQVYAGGRTLTTNADLQVPGDAGEVLRELTRTISRTDR